MQEASRATMVAGRTRHVTQRAVRCVARNATVALPVSPRGRAMDRPDDRRSARQSRTRHTAEDGFTLVELLVVVLMLVSLVGIAVPTFVGQRDGAVQAAVQSELRTAAIALESFRAQNGTYDAAALADAAYGYVPSLEVRSVLDAASVGDSFCVLAWHDPVDDPASPRAAVTITDARANAEWVISPSGMSFVGDVDGDRGCTP